MSPQQALRATLLPAQVDDALVELGRAGGVNFMADATGFSADVTPITLNSTETLEHHLAALNTKQKVIWLPYKRELLLWSAPDLRQLAQYILEGETIKVVLPKQSKVTTAIAPAGGTNDTARALPTLQRKNLYLTRFSITFGMHRDGTDTRKGP